jgi:ubiquinone/menaquinone biosynthesis C-methylase UbiE
LLYNPRVCATGYQNLLRRYQRYAPDYDRRFARYSEGTLNKALSLVPRADGDLLDVACGTGLFETKLRERRPGLSVTGVDISVEMLEKARQRFAGDQQVRFIAGTAERLDVPEESVDIVVCNNAFHLVQDAAAALREFRRVLRPQGLVIIVDWCMNYPQIALMNLVFRMTDRQVRSIRTVEALAQIMTSAGLSVTHRERFRVPPLWGLMALAARKVD